MSFLGGLLLAIIGFLFGRLFSQSELILSEKRRIYEEFLRNCPSPQDAFGSAETEDVSQRVEKLRELQGPLSLYASPAVMLALSVYLARLGEAKNELTVDSPALHPAYQTAATAQNDLILEMRRDALAWSAFAYRGPSRLPKVALENAKTNNLDP